MSVEHVAPVGADISSLFQISVNLVMEVVQMWHASFLPPPTQPLEDSEDYRPRHRPQDE